jgi:GT2 family glycosyltransferase
MIPTYNSGEYLARTLQSVLSQDPGPDAMQIEVVDGCSTNDDPQAIVDELGRGRVGFFRLPANRGAAHTFNVCIERSRGHWVHILHGDDMALDGFYTAYAASINAHPSAKSIFGQAIQIDERDRWIGVYGASPPPGGGIMTDFAERQAVRQLLLFNSAVVRRDAYEEVGGFSTLFDHVTDWDMWFRLGHQAPVAWVPRPYALYRVHSGSDTSTRLRSGANIRESYFVVRANLARLELAGVHVTVDESWRRDLARYADVTAWRFRNQRCDDGEFNQTYWAWLLDPNTHRLRSLAQSWLKVRLGPKRQAIAE